ncbi:auxin efflux carrier [Annulohypoxylon truncatum]|uniref:auxin efflux carrier n=1 Tax=Annulohypoxylon truncatum TaxID=327061 RepID=UPI0020076C1D|nr:auxin efflux carrier [Annulohypoxylon truncatum]KAI1208842.1 auxin efflux carrier [Annulohypoxylon truncatum]
MPSELLVSFLGAIQASLSVLITIGCGVAAAQFGLITTSAAEEVSHLCVTVLLPCLMIVKLGSELHLDTVVHFVPVVIWATIYTVTSIGIGMAAVAFFRLPKWAVPAIAFNNTQSLPLLLLQSLEATGVLSSLVGSGQTTDAIERARTYFLVGSVVSNTITFSLGPEWIVDKQEGNSIDPESQQPSQGGQGESFGEQQLRDDNIDHSPRDSESNDEPSDPDERTSLLPTKVVNLEHQIGNDFSSFFRSRFYACPRPVQKLLTAIGTFFNPPSVGAAIGLVIGLSPPLHRLFFSGMTEGGYFNAWLTASLKNIGELFVSLQVIVVGVKLSLSLRLMREGEDTDKLPLGTILCIIFIRFVLWPAISIPLVWALATYTDILPNDPILWWALSMLPAGPTAMKVLALSDVSGASQSTRMSIAKFLTLSYVITPIISFAVVGALKAAEAAKE